MAMNVCTKIGITTQSYLSASQTSYFNCSQCQNHLTTTISGGGSSTLLRLRPHQDHRSRTTTSRFHPPCLAAGQLYHLTIRFFLLLQARLRDLSAREPKPTAMRRTARSEYKAPFVGVGVAGLGYSRAVWVG